MFLRICARDRPRSPFGIWKKTFVARMYESRGRDASTWPRKSSARPPA